MKLDRIAVDFIVHFAEDNGFGVTHLETTEDAQEPPRVVIWLTQMYRTEDALRLKEAPAPIPIEESEEQKMQEARAKAKEAAKWNTLCDD